MLDTIEETFHVCYWCGEFVRLDHDCWMWYERYDYYDWFWHDTDYDGYDGGYDEDYETSS